jgi:tRNA threonylcarbamoyl adenosine modification protein (Sua5/YciO/YrdC/YwlC family)
MRMLRLHVNLDHPQPRHIGRAADVLRAGGLVIYPTDTTYGLGCDFFAKRAIDRIYQLKGMDAKHPLSFLCADLSEVARYGLVEDRNYRILRHHMPGKYTFILPATREVPKVVQSNARTVGVRIPESPVCLALIRELGHPLISTTVARQPSTPQSYINDPDEIAQGFGRSVEVFLDGGLIVGEPSSVVDLTGDAPAILRRGSGDLSWLE